MHPSIQIILAGLNYARFTDNELEGAINNALKNISADLAAVEFSFDPRTDDAIKAVETSLKNVRIAARAETVNDTADTEDDDDNDVPLRGRFVNDDTD
jgi:hypothetical protein